MKTFLLYLALGLSITPGDVLSRAAAPAPPPQGVTRAAEGSGGERSIKTTASVVVTLCEDGGDLMIRGWDRNEVSVRGNENNQVRLRSMDGAGGSAPATKVEVVVSSSGSENVSARAGCNLSADLALNVPRGATVEVKTRRGDVRIAEVAAARVETLSGDIEARGVSKGVEAKSISGGVEIRESSGRVFVRTNSGDIVAVNAASASAGDAFEAVTVNGEITLDRVSHARVSATSVIGSMNFTGALARGGRYDLRSSTGNVTLNLPPDASFRINARVTTAGTIITDFPVRYMGGQNASFAQRLVGVCGSGDALLNLVSYSGTVHLRRS